ncbi:MAG: hypothetical protein Q9164_005596 [Protoblastenia rupestris]
MAPTKTVRSKHVSKGPNKPSSSGKAKSSGSAPTKSRVSKKPKLPPPKQQKTKSSASLAKKKKKRVYTDEELGIPKLNMITPAGVVAPKGKKKGKIFVDDADSMMTILAIVNADKEGQIESKMMKSRQMEEIREARKKEAEKKQETRKLKLEDTKDALRKKRTRKGDSVVEVEGSKQVEDLDLGARPARKRVSFV